MRRLLCVLAIGSAANVLAAEPNPKPITMHVRCVVGDMIVDKTVSEEDVRTSTIPGVIVINDPKSGIIFVPSNSCIIKQVLEGV